MKYRLSVLNCISWLLVVVSLVWLLANYITHNTGEGWGILLVIALLPNALLALHIDFILQLTIRNRKWLNLFEAAILLLISAWFLL